MNLRSIFLYNVIPRKRVFIAFIGFLISSTIITGGGVLLTSIVDSTTSYLGESEDVLVVSNPVASTPYTSVLPLELAETITSIYGVLDVSPEVMTAAVYKSKAIYFRGVDIKKFWEFTEVTYLDGEPLSENDTYDVSVGINYAERNNLEIGDLMTVFSTRSDAAVELRVKSIFVTHTLLDDEIIAPLWIGQFFSFETFNFITHIRVKVDLEKIPDKESIRDLVNSNYGLTTVIEIPSGTTILNATVYIRTGKGSKVNESIILNGYLASFTLPFGEYEVQAEINGILSEPEKFILDDSTTITLFVDYRKRDITFHIITDEDEPIEDVKITVYSDDAGLRVLGGNLQKVYSDSDGYATLSVGNGSYVSEFEYGVYKRTMNFVTQEVNNFEIQLITRHPEITVKSPLNHSTIIGNELNVSISTMSGYSIYFYPDDDIGQIQEYYFSELYVSPPQSMLIPFDPGAHSLSVLVYNNDYLQTYDKSQNYAETKIYFTLEEEFPDEIGFLNAMNGSQIFPSTILEMNNTLSFNQGLVYSWNNEIWLELDEGFIVSPYQNGIHRLQLKAEASNDKKIWTYYFVIKNTPYYIGILDSPKEMRFQTNDTIQTWFNPAFPIVEFHWDADSYIPLATNGEITVQGLSEGNHTLYLRTNSGTLWYFRDYEIIVDNIPANLTINELNNSSIESGSILSYTLNETCKQVLFAWDNNEYSTSFMNSIPVPTENGNHNLSIRVVDLAGNVVQIKYTYNVINFAGTTAIDFYLQYEYSGLINQSYIDIQVFSNSPLFKVQYELTGPSSLLLNRTSLENDRLYLFEGEYSLSVIYWTDFFESYTRSFNFQICDGQNTAELYSHSLNASYNDDILVTIQAFDVSFTVGPDSEIMLADDLYYISYMLITFPGTYYTTYFITDTELPELSIISPSRGEEAIDVNLEVTSDAVDVKFKLEHDSRVFTYAFTEIEIDYNIGGMQLITFFLTDSFQNTRIVPYIFYNALNYVPIELEFQVFLLNSDFNISNLDIIVSNSFNSTTWSGTTDLNGKVYFYLFPGEFYVQFEYLDIEYYFVLDTVDGLNQTIYIGNSEVAFTIVDYYVGNPINDQFCTVRDLSGNKIATFITDSSGQASSSIPVGDFIVYFTRNYENLFAPFQVYSPGQQITFEIPSIRTLVQFDFVYDTGSKVYNLDVVFHTAFGNISVSTGLLSGIALWLSYGAVNISFTQLNGEYVTLTRSFEPGREIITITVESSTDTPWRKIPFRPISGFTFIISVSLEYMDYYLKGTLLFTYTLAYTEVILILFIVIVNMYSILENMHKESKRETRILRMIGGTNTNALITIFSRLGLIAVVCSFIGYGIGIAILKILSSANQTVFFGHTFSPSGGWFIFLLNCVLTVFIGLVATLIITRNAKKEKRIVNTKR